MQRTSEFGWEWKLIYNIHPYALRFLYKCGLHPSGRHPYLLGKLSNAYTLADLQKMLESAGFERDILSWDDEGQILSMRKVDKRTFQWHLRLYKDGAIHGHYEYAPERGMFAHMRDKVFRPERKYFIELLGDYLNPLE